MSNNKYTPATIDKLFSIPLYQRLFEWEDEQILQLLNDLYSSFLKCKTNPYYIGMLTTYRAKENERYSLVDGQQRFTVLNLIGIVFNWTTFLTSNNSVRLSFFARKNDEEYIKSLIFNTELEYKNKKMYDGINCIKNFITNIIDISHLEEFKNYTFEKTTFFITELPQIYTLQDLNRYFEAMNEAGKGLENHEILKVQLLKNLEIDKIDKYTLLWNSVSEMDNYLIKKQENESQETYKNRNVKIFNDFNLENVINILNKSNYDEIDNTKILKNIQASEKKPEEYDKERNESAILSFTDFLLQVLWLNINKENRLNSTEFFSRNKLLETFDYHILSKANTHIIDDFFKCLFEYKLIFDYYILRLNSFDERNVTYSLNQITDGNNYEAKRNLIHYQSMLYVSTDSHIWLTNYLEFLKINNELSIEDSLSYLKMWDNIRQNQVNISLTYGSIQRYWFWRLDYYLWQNRNNHFGNNEKEKKIADKYIFRPNRSIEHIAPQHPKSNSLVILDDSIRDRFGNLAMISSGQNTSLQNESFEIKREHVKSFINESIGGSIQSLKMLKIYKFDIWNETNINIHQNEMLNVLIDSFKDKEDKFQNIINQLESFKIKE